MTFARVNGCLAGRLGRAMLLASSGPLALLGATPSAGQAAATAAPTQNTTQQPQAAPPAALEQAAGAAQPEAAPADPEIVVTGFRASLDSALRTKRLDSRVTDGISAEDLGKFPSENITEAIQRISGVQMSNINGRGATISIRGLGPQYALTTINGQQFKSADFTDGFRFDIIQTELANSIQVVKSPTADMDAGGLSGTVNIETTKPLDYRSRVLVLSAKAQNAEFRNHAITPKLSGSYVDQFADGTLGVYLNLGYQKLEDRADYFWMDRWTTQTINGQTVTVPRRPRYRRIDRDTERFMASGGLQWRPSDALEVNATAIFAKDKTQYDLNQQVFLYNTSAITVNTVANGVATNTTATNFTMENNRQHEDRNLTSEGYTLSAKYAPGDGWNARAALNYTKGTSYQHEAAAILGVTIPSATLDISNPDAVLFSVGTNLASTSLYAPTALTRNDYPDGATRRLRSAELSPQIDLSKDIHLGPFTKVSVGAKYRHEIFNRYITREDIEALSNRPAPSSSVWPSLASNSYGVSNFLDGELSIPTSWVAPVYSAYDNALTVAGLTVPSYFAPESSYHVTRYMPSVYAMTDFATQIGSVGVRGNIGVRYEHTTQAVQGYITQPLTGSYTEVTQAVGTYRQSQTYSNVLPSLNVVVEPTSKFLIRGAAAQVLVRPIFDSTTSLAQVTSTSANTYPANTNTVTVDLGQAGLKPLTANQLDLGVEWYYGTGSAITIDGFYKWVKNGTYSALTCPTSFQGTALSQASGGDCVDARGNIYDITQTLNDPRTILIKGFEASWNQSLDPFLPVKGFGYIANFTRVYPQEVAIGTGYTVRNLSKVTWNATPYWENKIFNVRASFNYRSSYQQNYADSFFAYAGHTVRGRMQVDLSAGFSATQRLTFGAGVINLNKSREEAYYLNQSTWQETSFNGRSYYLTATLKL